MFAAGLVILPACRRDEHGKPAPPAPTPIDVTPFEMGSPDVVLIVTGSTHGMLEVCNCSGPMPGGLARRSGLVVSYRKAYDGRVVLLDTGDVFWIDPGDVRNRHVVRGCRAMGYDAIVLGDQEWAASNAQLAEVFPPGSATACLSTTVSAEGLNLPLARVIKRQFGDSKLAIVSDIRAEAFLFFDRNRYKQLNFMPHEELRELMQGLQDEGYAVVAVVHGRQADLEKAAAEMPADLILRGHTKKSSDSLRDVSGKPVVQVGGSEHAAVVGLRISPDGDIEQVEYRLDVIDDRWPLDKRMLEIYQAYAHEAMRVALDAKRKRSFDMMPAEKCGQCHRYQYEAWQASRHARAYQTLQRVGRTGDPNCLGCHTLGFGMEGGFYTFEKTPALAGVHCQNCHRFGYEEHRESGFEAPKVSDAVCTSCHTPVTDPHFSQHRRKRFMDMGCGPMPAGGHAENHPRK